MATLRTFTFADLGIGADAPRMEYRQRRDETPHVVKWNQRKLFFSELAFLTLHWSKHKVSNPVMVYAGAAKKIHLPWLLKMFPSLRMELYDPAKFVIAASDRITIFNTHFTDDIARTYAGRNDVFFVSDIGTANYEFLYRRQLELLGITEYDEQGHAVGDVNTIRKARAATEADVERHIATDIELQQHWVEIMNPVESLLKWRLEYPQNRETKKFSGLKGTLYWQIYTSPTSTEMRLRIPQSPTGVFERGEWDILEYEEWCMYHNTVIREQAVYLNIFTATNQALDYPELLNDYDSTAEAMIWKLYLEKFGIKDVNDAYEKTKALSRELTRYLNEHDVKQTNLTVAQRREGLGALLTRLPTDVFAKKGRRKFSPKVVSPRTTLAPVIVAPVKVAPVVSPKAPVIIAPVKAAPVVSPKAPVIVAPVKVAPVVSPKAPIIVAPVKVAPVVSPKAPVVVAPVRVAPVVSPKTPVVVAPITVAPVVSPKAPVIVAPITVAPVVSPKAPVTRVAPVAVAPITIAKAPVIVAPITTAKAPITVAPVVVTQAKAPVVVTAPKAPVVVTVQPKVVVAAPVRVQVPK